MTIALYLNNTYQIEGEGIITYLGTDEKGYYMVLNQTIFYPQGGGQPSDQGVIYIQQRAIRVYFVRQINQEIRHYIHHPDPGWINQNVNLYIDHHRRLLNARYHTAAHLIGNVVEALYPELQAIKGHSFPEEAYVEFIGNSIPKLIEIQGKINQIIIEGRETSSFEITPDEYMKENYKLPYQSSPHKTFRAVSIGSFAPVPCGGTHIKKVDEIGDLCILKVNKKSGRIKINYVLP